MKHERFKDGCWANIDPDAAEWPNVPCYDTREEAEAALAEETDGIEFGDRSRPIKLHQVTARDIVDCGGGNADDLLERLEEWAEELGGGDEPLLHTTPEAAADLDALLIGWIERHGLLKTWFIEAKP